MTAFADQHPDRPNPEKLATIGGECCPSNGSTSSCCGGASIGTASLSVAELSAHNIATAVGEIPVVATELTLMDRIGAWKVRWGIGRMRFTIPPGLYAVGKPNDQSPVLVTANYKMSFDRLRRELTDRDAWILVLDTKGINVWCAAGKGTFGTQELIRRIRAGRLAELLRHRKLILPQLGATGVAAHVVRRETGFSVRFGPVRAADLPAFLDNSRRASPDMRLVQFSLGDRLALAPVELIGYGRYALLFTVALALLSGFGSGLYSLERAWYHGLRAAGPILGGVFAGAVIAPAALPWLPGRSFSAKGAWAGLLWLVAVAGFSVWTGGSLPDLANLVAFSLMVPSLASFVAMNFTGSSTYTSLSGVRKEMRRWVRVQAAAFLFGLVMWVIARYV